MVLDVFQAVFHAMDPVDQAMQCISPSDPEAAMHRKQARHNVHTGVGRALLVQRRPTPEAKRSRSCARNATTLFARVNIPLTSDSRT
jgi:hypothetical protein